MKAQICWIGSKLGLSSHNIIFRGLIKFKIQACTNYKICPLPFSKLLINWLSQAKQKIEILCENFHAQSPEINFNWYSALSSVHVIFLWKFSLWEMCQNEIHYQINLLGISPGLNWEWHYNEISLSFSLYSWGMSF